MSYKRAWLTAAAVLLLAPFIAFVTAISGEIPSEPLLMASFAGGVFGAFCLLIASETP